MRLSTRDDPETTPTNLTATPQSKSSVQLDWTPILYTQDGGNYEVSYAPSLTGTYIIQRYTDSKYDSNYIVDNLNAGITYFFAVRTYTSSHEYQHNDLWSDYTTVQTTTPGDSFHVFLPLIFLEIPEEPNNPPNTPSSPSPANGAINQTIDTDSSWTGGDPDGGDTVTYDIYFEAGDNTPDVLVCNDVPTPSCNRDSLSSSTQYYWQVIAQDQHGTTINGPIWNFTTQAPSNLPLIYYLCGSISSGRFLSDSCPGDLWYLVAG